MSDCPNFIVCDCTPTFQVLDLTCQAYSPPDLYWNTEQCAFCGCPEGTIGYGEVECVPARRYSSPTSQADADAQAQAAAQQLACAMIITITSGTPPDPQLDTLYNYYYYGATVFLPYSFQFTATGGIGPYTWTHTGELPPGLTLDSDGLLHGTPTHTGAFTFVVTPHGVSGFGCSREYTIGTHFLSTMQCYGCVDAFGDGYSDMNHYNQPLDGNGFTVEDGLVCVEAGRYSSPDSQAAADALARAAVQARFEQLSGVQIDCESSFANALQSFNPCGDGNIDSNLTTLALDNNPAHAPDGDGYFTYGTYAQDGIFYCTAGFYTSLISQADADAKALQAATDRFTRWEFIDALGSVCCVPITAQPGNTVLNIADLTWGTYTENNGHVTIAGGDGTFGVTATVAPTSTVHMFGFGYRWNELFIAGGPGTWGGNNNPPGLWSTTTRTITVTVTFTSAGLPTDKSGPLNATILGGCSGEIDFACTDGNSPWTFSFLAQAYCSYSIIFCQVRYTGSGTYDLDATITLRPL